MTNNAVHEFLKQARDELLANGMLYSHAEVCRNKWVALSSSIEDSMRTFIKAGFSIDMAGSLVVATAKHASLQVDDPQGIGLKMTKCLLYLMYPEIKLDDFA